MSGKEALKSYEFYVKNFPYIKYSIEENLIKKNNNILLVIFYDVTLYKKYLEFNKDNDFKKLLEDKFMDNNIYNNENEGVFVICGDLNDTIDLVINNVFVEKRDLNKEILNSIGIDAAMKNNHCFYVSLLKIIFCDSKGEMTFKFNEIQNQFSDDDKKNI